MGQEKLERIFLIPLRGLPATVSQVALELFSLTNYCYTRKSNVLEKIFLNLYSNNFTLSTKILFSPFRKEKVPLIATQLSGIKIS